MLAAQAIEKPDRAHDEGGDPEQMKQPAGHRESELEDEPENREGDGKKQNGMHWQWIATARVRGCSRNYGAGAGVVGGGMAQTVA